MAAQDVVQSVREQPSLVASLFSVYGALREVVAMKVTKPPSPKGQHPRSRHTILSADLPGARAEMVPSTSALPISHSVDRAAWEVSAPARASPALLNASAADESTTVGGLKPASSDASAASESTSQPVVLRRFLSQSSAGAERNLSPSR